MEDYAGLLEPVFGRYGIPLFYSHRESILEKPILTLLTAALESTDPDAPYRMTLVMPSAVTTSTSVNDQRFYKMTTTVETISWTDGGTIHRKEAGS